jgi:ketosteroid isomerase-like protein
MELQDYEKLANLLTETFTWVIPVRAEGMAHVPKVRNKPFTVERIKANRDLMERGMSLKPVAWTVQDDRVALEAEGTVVWNNGKVYNNLYHLAFVIRDGKLDKFTEYCDYLYAWETNPLLSKPKDKA